MSSDVEVLAMARLIVTAPEMLESLKAAVGLLAAVGRKTSVFELPGYGGRTFDANKRKFEAVIAKAEGR